jgi:hypothetical protein
LQVDAARRRKKTPVQEVNPEPGFHRQCLDVAAVHAPAVEPRAGNALLT